MAYGIVSVHVRIYGMGIYAIMLPPGGFSVAHYVALSSMFTHLKIFYSIFESLFYNSCYPRVKEVKKLKIEMVLKYYYMTLLSCISKIKILQ